MENLTARDTAEKIAELSVLPPAELREMLLRRARDRWEQKVRFAGLRIKKLGWSEAAHHTAMEILGYRHNRAAMLAVAGRHPLAEWGGGPDLKAIYQEADSAWQVQGVRPANHPRRRLEQYAAWSAARPGWPDQLRILVATDSIAAEPSVSGQKARKQLQLAALRERVFEQISGGVIGGSRLDNLVCDGLLPQLAAGNGQDPYDRWFHWFLGDVPLEVRRALGTLGLAGKGVGPQTHGWAQGLLGWIIERDARASG